MIGVMIEFMAQSRATSSIYDTLQGALTHTRRRFVCIRGDVAHVRAPVDGRAGDLRRIRWPDASIALRSSIMKQFCVAVTVVLCLNMTPQAGAVPIADFKSSPNTFLWVGSQSNDWRNPANWLASPHSDRDYPHTAMDAAIIGGPHPQADCIRCDALFDFDGGFMELGCLVIGAGCEVIVQDGTLRLLKTEHQSGGLKIAGSLLGLPGFLYIEDGGAVDLASSVRHAIGGIIELRTATSRLVSTGKEVTLGPWQLTQILVLYGNVKGLNNDAMIGIQEGTTLINQITISGAMVIDAVNVSYVIRRADALPDAPPDDPPAPEHRQVARHDAHKHVPLP